MFVTKLNKIDADSQISAISPIFKGSKNVLMKISKSKSRFENITDFMSITEDAVLDAIFQILECSDSKNGFELLDDDGIHTIKILGSLNGKGMYITTIQFKPCHSVISNHFVTKWNEIEKYL